MAFEKTASVIGPADNNQKIITSQRPNQPQSWKDHLKTPACLAWFILLAVIYLWKPLFTGAILLPANPRDWPPWAPAEPLPITEQIKSNHLMSDSLLLIYPWRLYNHEMLGQGEIPFWNPHILSGYPHTAALFFSPLYPLTVIFDLWDPLRGLIASMLIHLAVSGSLMFWFLRGLGLDHASAAVGGTVFELNGFFLVFMGMPNHVYSGAWTPLLLLGLTDVIKNGKRTSVWKIGISVFLMFMGGHPQILALGLVLGGFWSLFQAWPQILQMDGFRRVTGRLLLAALGILLGFGLSALQLCPFLQLTRMTSRHSVEFAVSRSVTMPAGALVQAVVPDVFGHPVERTYWLQGVQDLFNSVPNSERIWRWNYASQNLYTGIAPLLLALCGFLFYRSRESLFFGSVGAAALLALFGGPFILRLFCSLVPTFKHSRPDRVIFLYMLAVSVLAAYGYMRTIKRVVFFRTSVWFALILAAVPVLSEVINTAFSSGRRAAYCHLADIARQQLPGISRILKQQIAEALVVGGATIAMLVLARRSRKSRTPALAIMALLIALPLCRFGWRFNPVQSPPLFPQSEAVDKLCILNSTGSLFRIAHFGNVFPANTTQVYGLFDVNGASAAPLRDYARLVHEADPQAIQKDKYILSFSRPDLLKTSLLDFLNVGIIVSAAPLPMFDLIYNAPSSNFLVYRNPDCLPRFFLVDRVQAYLSPESGIQSFLHPGFEAGRVALVEASAQATIGKLLPVQEPGCDQEVKLLSYKPHEIRLKVFAGGRRLLVSSEVDYPGWVCEVDGQRTRILKVNTAFRGAVVPGGEHIVMFRFVPRSFYLGTGISIMSGVLLVAFLIYVGHRGRKKLTR